MKNSILQDRRIEFGRQTVTKTSAPELMRIEVEKTVRAREIGLQSGLFRVPQVLEYNEKKGIAIFERLEVKQVAKAVPWGRARVRMGKELGAALAVIHDNMVLPSTMCTPLPEMFSQPGNDVFLHGDLTVENVCVGSTEPRLTILDWQMTPLYGGQATYGTRFFDILWLIDNLIHRPFVRFFYSNPVPPVISSFLGAYFSKSNIVYDASKFSDYAHQFFDARVPDLFLNVRPYRIGRTLLLRNKMHAIRQNFLESMSNL